jgi:hypothetical protein
MFPQWLRRRVGVKELEDEYNVKGVPFGYCNGEWKALLSRMEPGDELWTFSSPQEDWDQMMGSEEIALVRRGEMVASFCTRMN